MAWYPKMLVLSHGIRRIRICQSTSTVSYRQFHVTPIRAIFVHACTADVETSSIDVLWPVAQWSRKGAHSAASLSVSSNRCGPDRSLPLPVEPSRGCYWPTSLQRIRPAYAWAGRGRIQRTVSLDATRARAPAACPLLGSQQLVETPRILTPPCSAGLHGVLPGYQLIVSASSRL